MRGKRTFPNPFAAHGALMAHLMYLLMFCPYIYGLGFECCFLYDFTELFAYCNFIYHVLLQTFLSNESSEIL